MYIPSRSQVALFCLSNVGFSTHMLLYLEQKLQSVWGGEQFNTFNFKVWKLEKVIKEQINITLV